MFFVIRWLKEAIALNVGRVLWIPLLASSATFIANILIALSDGVISEREFHDLLQGASGVEIVVLMLVMAFLKSRNKP